MSHGYQAVTWTPFKKRFDLWMLLGVAAYLVSFIVVSGMVFPADEALAPIQLLIRATGTLAFLMLTFILTIGPLARLTPRFKPFLYNRRHLGVTTFLIALVHAFFVLLWYHGFSEMNVFVSLLVSNPRYDSIAGFPFESLGAVALIIMFLMAATSHDFWNANLAPGLWKSLHIGVYVAYALLVMHIALGALQFEKSSLYLIALVSGVGVVGGLHLWTAFMASGPDLKAEAGEWLKVCAPLDIEDKCAKVVEPPSGERIAVFRSGQKVFAISNVCRHQGGPLGEGRVIDDCVTCPWHGFQYRPEDGQSPPPFTEKIATYKTRIVDNLVEVFAEPNPPGTPQSPTIIDGEVS
jgi:nitrite reductase/ring-hydroxylating ferredoxin subunit/DMSO/TMAO reductase YedYZ heme-binding membrane subunit